jgi:hypothetical protein
LSQVLRNTDPRTDREAVLRAFNPNESTPARGDLEAQRSGEVDPDAETLVNVPVARARNTAWRTWRPRVVLASLVLGAVGAIAGFIAIAVNASKNEPSS